MALRLSVEMTFLIDLERERSAPNDDGAAHRFLKRSPDAELFLSTIALGEFAEGFDWAEYTIVAATRDGQTLVPVDDHTAFVYASGTGATPTRRTRRHQRPVDRLYEPAVGYCDRHNERGALSTYSGAWHRAVPLMS